MYLKLTQKVIITLIFSIITVCFISRSFADDNDLGKGTVTGYVLTDNNKPIENVSVSLKGTSYGATTNENGKFHFKAPAGNYTLLVSHVGARAQEVAITVNVSKTTVVPNITLDISASALQQVTVNASKTNKFSTKKSDYVAKMPLNDLENPQSYTTVPGALLQEQGVFSADAAIKNVPGITTLWTPTGRAGDGGSYFSLRGFTVQSTLRNGIAGQVTNTSDAANLESLEVIKGPSGTLYGSSLVSFGGLINRVTKKPFDETAGEISYSGGSYNFNRVSVDYNTPLDSAKKALFRINTAYNSIGSFQDNGYNKDFVFDPSFTYKVNDRLKVSFDAEISHGTGTTPPIFYFQYGVPVSVLGATNANKLNLNYKLSYQSNDLATTSDNVNFYGQVDYKISDNWTSQTNFATTNSSSSGYGPYFYLSGPNTIDRNVWEINGNANTLQIQQNFNGDFKIGKLRNRIIAGIDFLQQVSNLKYTDPNKGSDSFDVINTTGPIANYNNFNKTKVDSLFNNVPVSTAYSRYTNNTYSAYVSDVLNVTDNLLVMASLRLDDFTTLSQYDAVGGTNTPGSHQVDLSPKFGVVYQILKDQISVFGNYMNGFSNVAGVDFSGKAFKPQQANQLEGGVKFNLFNGRLSSTVSYYDIKVTNTVMMDPAHPQFSIQQGTQYSKGVEAEITANPVNGLNILLGYSYNKSQMTKGDSAYNGRRPETAGPPTSANFYASYTLTSGSVKGLGIGFGGNYASNNEIINEGYVGGKYIGTFNLPSYTILNTGVFYNKEKYRIGLNVNNLTNREYWVGYTTVDPQMLRQVIGSFTYKF
jgi:iron complex outermembrane receptor protein